VDSRDREQITASAIRDRVLQLLHDIANLPPDSVSDDSSLDSDLRLESIAFVELQVAVEEEYDIQLDPIEIVELNRFSDIVNYIAACVQQRP